MRKQTILRAAVVVLTLIGCGSGLIQAQRLVKIDYRKLISRGNLDYSEPARRSEEGMPVGNGRMGSLVWTTPSSLKFQINRVDVFAVDGRTASFPVVDSDYASGCAYVDIHVASAGEDVFSAGPSFNQHLSIYDGLMTASGKGLTARVLGWPANDVMAVEIDDQRSVPEPVNVDLRMLRYSIYHITGKNYEMAANHSVDFLTGAHSALSILDIRDGRITLTQKFRENDFYDSSAVAIGILDRASKARYLNESTVQLSAAPGKGKFTILIASAASFDPAKDTASLALHNIDAAVPKGFAGLQSDTSAWWHDFWTRSFVAMKSESGQAELVEGNYSYFQYLMGSTSRGDYPPRFGGMLWYTNGDMRRWGSQYWWANTNAYYSNLMPTNRPELLDPFFSMYFSMREACATAAEQQWGSKGIWIPEICWFNGPERLPDDVAAEIQDLYLMKKPFEERSARFQSYVETRTRHASRWNFLNDGKWVDGHFVVPTKGQGIFGHCTHILASGARVAQQFYRRYEFTNDMNWLRDRAYPMIKGSAEFYRNFPNLKKEADGKYHIHHVNNGESDWDSSDTRNEIGAMSMIFPLAIQVSETLGVDAELRPVWKDIADNLASPAAGSGRRGTFDANRPRIDSPTGPPRPAQQATPRGPRPFGAFVYGGPGAIDPIGPEPELKSRFLGFNALGSFIDAKGIGDAQIFRNRMRLREGPGAIDAEHIGGLSSGINSTMVASTEGTISIFNGWPKTWDAAFTLLAPGAFMVSSAQQEGKIPLVEIHSKSGGRCRLRNPWGTAEITLWRNGRQTEDLSGENLAFGTTPGETVVLVPKGTTPAEVVFLR
ncbi:MAG: glycoside hydrolase [Acidobacteria bacterium]|nr:MAG: glycoside hydrolase [Acidobacteriota bacterium]